MSVPYLTSKRNRFLDPLLGPALFSEVTCFVTRVHDCVVLSENI